MLGEGLSVGARGCCRNWGSMDLEVGEQSVGLREWGPVGSEDA